MSEYAPGLRMFACTAYRATLSTKTCASRWTKAQEAFGEEKLRLEKCRACPIGAAHAGHDAVRLSRWYDTEICPRCLRGGLRMVRQWRLCISCYNRKRELERGRNGRGNAPVELQARAPRPVDAIVSIDGDARRVQLEVTGLQEFMVRTLQTTKGDIAFAFAGPLIQRRADLDLSDEATVGQDESGVDDRTDHGGPAPAPDAIPDVATRRQAVLRNRAVLLASAARTPAGVQSVVQAASRRAWRAWAAGPKHPAS